MIFHSVDFAFFFAVVFALYWFVVPNRRIARNIFLLLAGYFFYASWDWRYLLLLLFSTAANYAIGIQIGRCAQKRSRQWLLAGIVVNLSLLGVFKYYAFFAQGFSAVFSIFGSRFQPASLALLLPVGISFYTFQNLGYLTDVFRKTQQASTNYLDFSLFVGFFPQLVAGPIPKASHLMPQIAQDRPFNYSRGTEGLRLIVLGLFEKMVIADNCALVVNDVYANAGAHNGSTLFFAAVLFSFQIYGDFSGYSHMAIGCAKLLGFDLRKNFNYPYLAGNIADFWRRWHISFSVWLRDYIYIPLGGNRNGRLVQARNLLVVFLVSGIWHGATLNFAIYGLIHGSLYVMYVAYRRVVSRNDRAVGRFPSALCDLAAIAGTFVVLALARIFFRSPDFDTAIAQLQSIFSSSVFEKPAMSRLLIALMFAFLFAEWLQRDRDHLLDVAHIRPRALRYAIYFGAVFVVFYFSAETQRFIYSRF